MVVARTAACALLFIAFAPLHACTPTNDAAVPPNPTPQQRTTAFEGESCTPGGTLKCANALQCKPQPYTKPVLEAGATRSPSDPNDVGGACGGVVGFHCAEGLDCVMPPDQVMVADGMGTCAVKGICTR